MKGAALVAQRIERAEKQPPSVATSALLGWLRGKIEDAEKALRFAESEEEAIAKEGEITGKQVTVSKSAVKKSEE